MSTAAITTVLDRWLNRQLTSGAAEWLRNTLQSSAAVGAGTRALFIAFSLTGRRCGRDDLQLNDSDKKAATEARPQWNPAGWSLDQAVRTRLVLALSADDPRGWLTIIDQLFAAAGLEELVALYQALPLLPHQELLAPRIAEGLRSNMTAVFNAVALHNPIASEQLNVDAWNQLILKALFVNSPVQHIVGAERRANPMLAQMLIDYARERYAAKRPIPVDLWLAARPGCDARQRVKLDQLQASVLATLS
jgi:hypothetical protein